MSSHLKHAHWFWMMLRSSCPSAWRGQWAIYSLAEVENSQIFTDTSFKLFLAWHFQSEYLQVGEFTWDNLISPRCDIWETANSSSASLESTTWILPFQLCCGACKHVYDAEWVVPLISFKLSLVFKSVFEALVLNLSFLTWPGNVKIWYSWLGRFNLGI